MESQQYAAMIENMKGQSARDRETIEIYDKVRGKTKELLFLFSYSVFHKEGQVA